MSVKSRIAYCCGVVLLLLAIAACQAQVTPVAIAPAPTLAPPPPPDTPTPAFLRTVPIALPAERMDQAGDVDSSPNANRKMVSGGDEFVNGLYERPFNSNTMDTYFPYLDIIGIQGFKDETWGYATITLAGADANGGLPGQYAAELDLNRDGRGDWLIRASDPAGTDWTTQGVQAWKDSNTDMGGRIAMATDKGQHGDGYETLVFDQGKGDLVDGAWVRLNPDHPQTVDLAFKLSMLGDPSVYAMGTWAGTNLDPAQFDHNDLMTHMEAGSPLPSYYVYPLKALAEIDNACRLAIGFAPTGKEPGLCATTQREREGTEPCFYNPNLGNFWCPPAPP